MNAPQIAIIVLFTISIVVNSLKHGEKHDMDYSLWLCLARVALWWFILYEGGFWS